MLFKGIRAPRKTQNYVVFQTRPRVEHLHHPNTVPSLRRRRAPVQLDSRLGRAGQPAELAGERAHRVNTRVTAPVRGGGQAHVNWPLHLAPHPSRPRVYHPHRGHTVPGANHQLFRTIVILRRLEVPIRVGILER